MSTTTITNAQLEAAGHDEDNWPHIRALCAFLNCEPGELKTTHNHYELPVFCTGNGEFAIGTDSEADSAGVDYVKNSIWAFNTSFILGECGLPCELEDCIRSFQEKECESANDALLALVEKCSSLESFAQAAFSADGRGHFLSGYDGNENEQEDPETGETFYIYRTS